MKALCVSDKVVDRLYSANVVQTVGPVDVIFGCGDLPYYYLEYLLTLLDAPLFYVHGNHDPEKEYTPSGEAIRGPGGGLDLDERIVDYNGLLIGGLQGSIRYKREGSFQHTEREMWFKVFRLVPHMIFNKAIKGRYLDILIAHSPPLNIHNGRDHVHRGFASFLWLMKHFKPRYLFHGHHHVYRNTEQTETPFAETIVNNVYPFKVLDLDLIENVKRKDL